MIVKNEETYLHDCLESMDGVADEIILVDTGCTDHTIDIAREFGAQIYRFPWKDDFAAARNESLRHASCDWIFQIDADERLLAESKEELRRLLKKSDALCVNVLIDSPKRESGKGHVCRAHRLFRNLPGIRYNGRIHEQISPSVIALKGRECFSTIKLRHLGYAKNEQEMQKKSRRNYLLLKKQIAEEPNNAYWHYSLAQNQILNAQYEDALDSLNESIRLGGLPKDIRCTILNNLAEIHIKLGRYGEAIKFANQSLTITRRQTLSHLMLFEAYVQLGDIPQQINYLRSALDVLESQKQAYDDVSLEAYVDPASLHLALGQRLLTEGRFTDAHASFEKAHGLDTRNMAALLGLGDSLIGMGQFERSLAVLRRIKDLAPDNAQNLEKLAWVLLKQQDHEAAITAYRELLRFHPENLEIKKRLAALYHKMGQTEKSRSILLSANAP
ncbi:tetratricopeptide repeat protein [bacterium]|nr:tetratricopeptide repeat protein [bacterium]